MKPSFKTGFSFGLTSAIITTLGLIVGLHAGTHSKIAIMGGIFTIAIADAFSDALGIHVSQESQNKHSSKSIWQSTVATFLSKFVFALTFIVPIVFFELSRAILVNVIWGFSVLSTYSYVIAKQRGEKKPWRVVAEHLIIGFTVVLITHFVGDWISAVFG